MMTLEAMVHIHFQKPSCYLSRNETIFRKLDQQDKLIEELAQTLGISTPTRKVSIKRGTPASLNK